MHNGNGGSTHRSDAMPTSTVIMKMDCVKDLPCSLTPTYPKSRRARGRVAVAQCIHVPCTDLFMSS
eukprot:6104051-Lingulodinium_polyedra.AAC.1